MAASVATTNHVLTAALAFRVADRVCTISASVRRGVAAIRSLPLDVLKLGLPEHVVATLERVAEGDSRVRPEARAGTFT